LEILTKIIYIMDLANIDWTTLIWSLIAIFEVVVRLTPSEKDNSILNKVVWFIDKVIPNRTK
tara:strand:+ start:521 stop:706 length:186 start_codon:yes stop_codon:yes gene_type:complete